MTPRSNFCHYDIQSTSSTRKKSDDVFDDDDGSVNEKLVMTMTMLALMMIMRVV